MIIDKLILDLENNYKKNFDGIDTIEESIKIINEIFYQIRNKDEYYNLFLDELNENFIKYFKTLVKNLSNKDFQVDFKRDDLTRHKYFTSNISNQLLEKIKNLINYEIEILKQREKDNKLSRFELTISGGLKIIRVIKLLNKEFNNNGHLKSVSNYMGYKSEVNGLAIELSSKKSKWWKHKKENIEPKTLAVHLDKEFTCVKSILYLNDVELDGGPFSIYPNIYEDLNLNIFQDILGRIILETACQTKNTKLKNYLNIKDNNQPFSSKNLVKIYSNLPNKISFNSHFGWELESGSELENKILNNKKIILGKAGTMITFDGSRLLHSGGLVKKNNRIALQIIYSRKINPFIKYFKKLKNKFI